MTYLVLTFYYPPDLCAGSFRNDAFVKALRRKIKPTDKIVVISTSPNRYHTYNQEVSLYEIDGNLEIHRVGLKRENKSFVDQILNFLTFAIFVMKKSVMVDTSIVYASSSRLFTAFLGLIVSRIKRVPLVLDIRDLFTDTVKDAFNKKIVRVQLPIMKFIEKITFEGAHHLNIVSEGFVDYLKKYKIKRISFYPNGIDPEFLNVDYSKSESECSKVISYAGNIGKGQGLEKVIPKLAKKLGSEYQINIYGEGGIRKDLESSIRSLGVDNVRLFKPVNRLELIEIYKQSDYLFLHLNNYEAFLKVLPSKIFEYGATGKTIVAGVGGYAAKFIKENLPGSIVRSPCDYIGIAEDISNIENVVKDNHIFISKYSREKIMDEFVDEIVTICRN